MLKYLPAPVWVPETLTGVRAKKKVIPQGHGYGGALYVCHGGYTVPAQVEDGDIFEMLWTPKNFLCLGGQLCAADIDTHGTETLDMDIGWVANGGGSEKAVDTTDGREYTNAAATSSPTGLLNAGIWDGDISLQNRGGGNLFILNLPTPLLFTRPTLIQVEANAAAATFTAGAMSVSLWGRIL